MKDTPRDYTILNELALKLGFKLTSTQGIYLFRETIAKVDLSACAENEISILKTAVVQLSEQIDENYYDLLDRQQNEDFIESL